MIFEVRGKRYRWHPLRLLETVAASLMVLVLSGCVVLTFIGGL